MGLHNIYDKIARGEMPSSGSLFSSPAGILLGYGATVPSGVAGYAPGALFIHVDGSAGTLTYVNEGTAASCSFSAVAALTAAQEALLGATAGVATASKALILDSNGHLASGTIIMDDMTPGTGISAVATAICEHSVVKVGGLIKTEILVDLTGLNSSAAKDIIGKQATANCHIGQITAAKNGTIFAGSMQCLEAPTTGVTDIDLYCATEATGTEDVDIETLSETKLLDAGEAWAAGAVKVLSAYPAADKYLYLVGSGDGADATYATGIFVITLWGKAA